MSEENNELLNNTENTAENAGEKPEVEAEEIKNPETAENAESAAQPEEIPSDAAEVKDEPKEAPEPEETPAAHKYSWSYEAQLEYEKQNEKHRGRRGAMVYAVTVTALFAICFAVLAALIVFGTVNGFGKTETVYLDRVVYVRETPEESSGVLSTQEIAAKVIPSTVGVSVKTASGSGTGTGIILDKEGYIVTNHHVVEDAVYVTVVTSDSREFEAVVVGSHAASDIAVLKIEPGDYELQPAEFADSDQALVGDTVVAIGNAGGLDLFGTVTRGVISGVNRQINFYDSDGLVESRMILIQTDALINPGNSGGPLVDIYGRVIGINFMKYADDDYEGIGFAIPSKGALEVVNAILDKGYYDGYAVAVKGVSLGIRGGSAVEGFTISSLGVTPGASGVIVTEIIGEDSSVYGYLEVYDIITAVNGKTVSAVSDIKKVVDYCNVGDKITLTVYRDGSTFDVTITLK